MVFLPILVLWSLGLPSLVSANFQIPAHFLSGKQALKLFTVHILRIVCPWVRNQQNAGHQIGEIPLIHSSVKGWKDSRGMSGIIFLNYLASLKTGEREIETGLKELSSIACSAGYRLFPPNPACHCFTRSTSWDAGLPADERSRLRVRWGGDCPADSVPPYLANPVWCTVN